VHFFQLVYQLLQTRPDSRGLRPHTYFTNIQLLIKSYKPDPIQGDWDPLPDGLLSGI